MTDSIAGPQFPDVADNLVEEEDDSKPFNIFEYIGRPTAERGVRHKLSGDTARKMGKLDALRILMSIAGDTWEKDLLLGAREEGRGAGQGAGAAFTCPRTQGHFPDPASCRVYYTCSGGVAARHTCQVSRYLHYLHTYLQYLHVSDGPGVEHGEARVRLGAERGLHGGQETRGHAVTRDTWRLQLSRRRRRS